MRQNVKCPNCDKFAVEPKVYRPTGQTDMARAYMLFLMAGALLSISFIAFSYNGAGCGAITLPLGLAFGAGAVYKFKHQVAQCSSCGMQFSAEEIQILALKQGANSKFYE